MITTQAHTYMSTSVHLMECVCGVLPVRCSPPLPHSHTDSCPLLPLSVANVHFDGRNSCCFWCLQSSAQRADLGTRSVQTVSRKTHRQCAVRERMLHLMCVCFLACSTVSNSIHPPLIRDVTLSLPSFGPYTIRAVVPSVCAALISLLSASLSILSVSLYLSLSILGLTV